MTRAPSPIEEQYAFYGMVTTERRIALWSEQRRVAFRSAEA